MELANNPGTPIKAPKLSIGVGVFNDARFLRGCLDSLSSQTFTDYELIISDNASTDETPAILKEYAGKDSRIRVIRQQENIGLIPNYNFLLKQAVGEYFMWAACDDRWSPDFVKTIIAPMEQDHSLVLGFSPFQVINENGETYGPQIKI